MWVGRAVGGGIRGYGRGTAGSCAHQCACQMACVARVVSALPLPPTKLPRRPAAAAPAGASDDAVLCPVCQRHYLVQSGATIACACRGLCLDTRAEALTLGHLRQRLADVLEVRWRQGAGQPLLGHAKGAAGLCRGVQVALGRPCMGLPPLTTRWQAMSRQVLQLLRRRRVANTAAAAEGPAPQRLNPGVMHIFCTHTYTYTHMRIPRAWQAHSQRRCARRPTFLVQHGFGGAAALWARCDACQLLEVVM